MALSSQPSQNLRALDRLHKYNRPAADVDQLRSFVEKAEDRELFRLNPRYLADALKWSEPRTLDMLTLLAAEDLWNLEWEAFCPGCGGAIQEASTLGHLHAAQSCGCGWQGYIMLDRAVSVCASLSPDVRRLDPARQDDPQFRDALDARLGRLPALALVNRPLFREVLGEQTLPPDQSLGVQELVVFFSDLKSSTALYQRLGDANAYRLVRQHFDVIFAAVERHGGSAVKTIGDGVMGTFFDRNAAVQGVAECITGIQAINRQAGLSGEDSLRLKVGMHVGPCIVVTLNHRLDYFGSTVNIASRLSNLAEGDDLLVSGSILADEAARRTLQSLGRLEGIDLPLRGVVTPVGLHRLQFAQ